MKQILFALLLTSLCFIAINSTPITTTPAAFNSELLTARISCKSLREIASEACNRRWIKALIIRNGTISDTVGERIFHTYELIKHIYEKFLIEGRNNKYLYVMVNAYPIRKILTKYFAALNNTDLLSACVSCKSFCEVASEVLKERIKPLIIRNGIVSNAIDQRIFPAYETTDDIYRDFFALEKWQSDFFLNKCSNWLPKRRQSIKNVYLHVISCCCLSRIVCSTSEEFSGKLPRDAILIPKVYNDFITYFIDDSHFNESVWKRAIYEAKLSIIFTYIRRLESKINFDICSFSDSRSMPICYATRINTFRCWKTNCDFLFLIFQGSNVEASTFLVETNDEEELREKLLEWKRGLDFLESHHLIAFYLTKIPMNPTSNEEIFRQIFDIHLLTVQLYTNWWAETGLAYINSTIKVTSYGPVYAIVGFKKI